MLLPVHIAAAALALVLGAVALLVKKGGWLHRRAGIVFVYAMVVMGLSASILAFRKSPADPNVFGGLMTLYFVGTALTTVRRESAWTRGVNIVALTLVLLLGILSLYGSIEIFNLPGRTRNGVPFVMPLFLGVVMLLSAYGDLRVIRFGPLRAGARLARHLWRMCFALFIAAGSFFSVRSRVATILPEPFTSAPMRMLPIVLIFAAMFYWLWRVRRRPLPVTRVDSNLPRRARIQPTEARRLNEGAD
jgi:uncharacterized membrane protein